MKAKCLIPAPAIIINTDTLLKKITSLLTSHHVTTFEVQGAEEKVRGIISWYALFPEVKTIRRPQISIPVFRKNTNLKHTVASCREFIQLTARNTMSPSPFCVDADNHLGKVVWAKVQYDFVRFLAQEL